MATLRRLSTLIHRLKMLFRVRQAEDELDEEIRYHLDRQIQEFIQHGLTPEEARSAALQEFGGVDRRKEECRDARRLDLVENIFRDCRYAVRGFAKSPAFTLGAVLTLALGIGANSAVFTIINSVLLRQLPFRNADGLVWIWST